MVFPLRSNTYGTLSKWQEMFLKWPNQSGQTPLFFNAVTCSGGGNQEKVNRQTPRQLSWTWRRQRQLAGTFPLQISAVRVRVSAVSSIRTGSSDLSTGLFSPESPWIGKLQVHSQNKTPCERTRGASAYLLCPSLIYRVAFNRLRRNQSQSLLLLQTHLWGKNRRHDDRHTESKITTGRGHPARSRFRLSDHAGVRTTSGVEQQRYTRVTCAAAAARGPRS